MQNLIYALIQVFHNEGAGAIVALGAYGTWMVGNRAAPRLALALTLLWGLQGCTGALFGVVTFLYDHHLPDIHGIAVKALILKMLCVICGFSLAFRARKLAQVQVAGVTGNQPGAGSGLRQQGRLLWPVSLALGMISLGSAAFLRWFS